MASKNLFNKQGEMVILKNYHDFLLRNFTASTVESRVYHISEFLNFCSTKNIALNDIGMRYLHQYLQRRSFSIGSLNVQITCINNFMMWCESIGIVTPGSFKRLQRFEESARRKIILSDFQFKRLSDLLIETERKEAVLIKILYFTAITTKQLIGLKIRDVSFKESRIFMRDRQGQVVGSVPIFKEIKSDLQTHIKSMTNCSNYSEFLFSKKNGKCLTRTDLYGKVSKFLGLLNACESGPRIIRNTRGFHLLRSFTNLTAVSGLLNIKEGGAIRYTYTDIVNYTKLQEIYRAAHPRA